VDQRTNGRQHHQRQRRQRPRRDDGAVWEEDRHQNGQHAQPRRAWHQRGQQDGQQSVARRVDDPRAHHGGHVAAEPEKERQEALAVQA